MSTEELAAWLGLHLWKPLTPLDRERAVELLGPPSGWVWTIRPGRLAELVRYEPGSLVKPLTRGRRDLKHRVATEVRAVERLKGGIVTRGCPGFPRLLREIPDPPVALSFLGRLPDDGAVPIAIVGSRRASAYGRNQAGRLAGDLAKAGATVVSGGARGIDTAAHEAALESGGRTIVVAGAGLGHPYPRENAALFEEIVARGGAIVSELACDEAPRAFHFPRRNRVLAGLSIGTIVVEATQKSGSLITSRLASEQGREVFAVPGPVTSPGSAGPHALIQDGAKLVAKLADVVVELPPPWQEKLAVATESDVEGDAANLVDLQPDEERVLGLLDPAEPVQLDILADRIPIGIARLQVALFGLELRGAVEQLPGRYYAVRVVKDAKET